MALVIDTGVLLAALLDNEDHHDACRTLLETTREQLVIPAPVFVELEYLLCHRATFSVLRTARGTTLDLLPVL